MIHPNLHLGIQQLLSAPLSLLKEPEWVASLIRRTGLHPDGRREYRSDGSYPHAGFGLLQIPGEIAELLVLLSGQRLRTVLEIGTYNGWTTAILTAYLSRWNSGLSVVSIDPYQKCFDGQALALSRMLPVTFGRLTSGAFRGDRFDFCFIDGDHAYASIKADYLNVGKHATLCAIHDINDYEPVPGHHDDGGAPRFWQELRQSPEERAAFYEIKRCPPGRRFMGIGIRVRR